MILRRTPEAAEAAAAAAGGLPSVPALREFYVGVLQSVRGGGAEGGGAGDDTAADLASEIAILARSARRATELEAVVAGCTTALRARRDRTAEGRAADGTAAGVLLEVRQLVQAEAEATARQRESGGAPPGAARHVLAKLQAIRVSRVSEVASLVSILELLTLLTLVC